MKLLSRAVGLRGCDMRPVSRGTDLSATFSRMSVGTGEQSVVKKSQEHTRRHKGVFVRSDHGIENGKG